MSDSITVEAPEARRRSRERPERAMTDAPEVAVLSGDDNAQPDAEQELADARRAIQARDATLAQEREARTRAEREAARALAGRATDRSAAVAAAVEAATSDQTRARQAMRVARESGDLDAEMKANEELSAATYRAAQAAGELAAMKAGDPTSAAGQMQQAGQPQQQPQQPQGGTSAAAQAWIAAHPRFNSDRGYKAAMIAAHTDLVADGVAPDSPAYFRALDEAAATLDGGRTQRTEPMPEPRQSYNGAPPSRGGSGGNGRGGTVQTPLGPVSVTRKSDGNVGVAVAKHLRGNFEEGARISNMNLGDYIYEQVLIAEERQAGGDGGWQQEGERN
jgi:hypothetical protein